MVLDGEPWTAAYVLVVVALLQKLFRSRIESLFPLQIRPTLSVAQKRPIT